MRGEVVCWGICGVFVGWAVGTHFPNPVQRYEFFLIYAKFGRWKCEKNEIFVKNRRMASDAGEKKKEKQTAAKMQAKKNKRVCLELAHPFVTQR